MSENLKKAIALAAELDGKADYDGLWLRKYRKRAEEEGLVLVFGYSDDGMEFDGALYDHIHAFDGTTAYLDKDGLLEWPEGCDCETVRENCKYIQKAKDACKTIEALWGENDEGYAWTFKTDIPHATFDILEDGEKFCKGIVFHIDELKND